MSESLLKTPLHAWHAAHGGRMVDFAGWSMPVQYVSIVSEHNATRNAAGLFDVSHMARLTFQGPQAGPFLDQLVTRRVADMKVGQVRYALVTNYDGGILDDVLVYRLPDRTGGEPCFQVVVNASNRPKIIAWIESQRSADLCEFDDWSSTDRTHESAMIAVQGPRALALLQPLTAVDLAAMKYYTSVEVDVLGAPAVVSRTGYTGEDGCEVILPAAAALPLWEKLLETGASQGVVAAGLGCRDTLRLEAGMPLYGHELTERINPLQAGLGFAVNLEGRTFVGCTKLAQCAKDNSALRRVGIELFGPRVPREGYLIFHNGEQVGQVTSGTYSPTLDQPIAMGYLRPELSEPSTELDIDIRGRKERGRVIKLPFYRRPM